MFMGILQINSSRVHRALLKKKSGNLSDLRGKKVPHNKSSPSTMESIKNHIQSFPTIVSHYCRTQSQKKYLDCNLNLSLMYRLYVDSLRERNVDKVPSQSLYEKVFRREFNLSFKSPRKDTCQTCDRLNIEIKAAEENKDEAMLKTKKLNQELHHRKVQLARSEINEDVKISKEGKATVISFDLQKVMLLPKLTTGVVYYKRQLSCYNLGIHNFENNVGTMHVWDESTASRGSQEIGSCILKFINTHDHKDILIAWSDSCGGQNRNINIAALWMYIVQSPTLNIKEVVHKFAEPGHSYLQNDSDFGDIEKKLKYHPEIYVPTQWHNIISNSRVKKNKFEVVCMEKEDFKSMDALKQNLVNRKKDSDEQKVEWLKIKQMKFTQDHPGVMEFKYTHNKEIQFYSVNLNKRLKGRPVNLASLNLSILYPEGRKLSQAKLNDIRSLLQFVPPCHHQFYNKLQQSEVLEDDIEEENDNNNEEENEMNNAI
ncbi:uncharacterized protein [Diabrotica undecimpunctata]|uniref:uncharacterized protein n=1 Tax=Diabrotica undecimpunctata TaxID=50387 RepID=UPI003B6417D2